MCDRESAWSNLLWLLVAAPVMCVHYSLFKHGGLLTERASAAFPERLQLTRLFASPRLSPALKASRAIARLLTQTENQLGPLGGYHGAFSTWPAKRRRLMRRALLLTLGQLWRKLVEPWRQYPWKLMLLQDQEVAWADCWKRAQDFLAAKECCLDVGFSKKLRDSAERPEQLFEEDLQFTLRSVADRVVVSSTLVERIFAHYTQWTTAKCRGRRPTLATLAAKHMTSQFRQSVEVWRKASGRVRADRKSRPVWARSTGGRATGLHLFTQDMARRRPMEPDILATAQAAWAALPRHRRLRWSLLAHGRNSVALARRCHEEAEPQEAGPHVGGPWCASVMGDAWPLATQVLEEAWERAGGFRTAAGVWQRVRQGVTVVL